MSLSFTSRLSEDFNTLLEYAEDYDVIIRVGKRNLNKQFQAHSIILRARSEYFRAALSNKWARKEGTKYIFEKPNVSPIVFGVILRYIYSGNIVLDKLSGGDILELLVAVDELILEELTYPLQDYLLQHKLKWIQDNILYVLNIVIERKVYSKLKSHCLSIVCPSPLKFFESKEFIKMDETTMVSLLSRDDLCMEEEKIWDYLIKWGMKNTPNLKNSDVSKWNLKDFNELEKTLQRCIPLIRYWQLSPEVFNSKVRQFEKILPRNLKLRLLQRFLTKSTMKNAGFPYENKSPFPRFVGTVPPERTIDSTIIAQQHAALIACWIDRKIIKDSSSYVDMFPTPYYFRLLFRGSRDGFSAKTFHNKCDGQGATIVVVKIGDSKELIGGYNPIGWSSPRDVEWRGTRDCFIFSLGDGKELGKAKLSRIKGDCVNDAILLQDRLGPSFGFYELKIIDGAQQGGSSYASGGLRYESKIRDKFNYFGVDDYEVFQVIKK